MTQPVLCLQPSQVNAAWLFIFCLLLESSHQLYGKDWLVSWCGAQWLAFKGPLLLPVVEWFISLPWEWLVDHPLGGCLPRFDGTLGDDTQWWYPHLTTTTICLGEGLPSDDWWCTSW